MVPCSLIPYLNYGVYPTPRCRDEAPGFPAAPRVFIKRVTDLQSAPRQTASGANRNTRTEGRLMASSGRLSGVRKSNHARVTADARADAADVLACLGSPRLPRGSLVVDELLWAPRSKLKMCR